MRIPIIERTASLLYTCPLLLVTIEIKIELFVFSSPNVNRTDDVWRITWIDLVVTFDNEISASDWTTSFISRVSYFCGPSNISCCTGDTATEYIIWSSHILTKLIGLRWKYKNKTKYDVDGYFREFQWRVNLLRRQSQYKWIT